MAKKKKSKSIDKEREMALNSLPPSIRNSLTEEEVELFLNSEEWPESLFEKLSEFIIGSEDI
jgi:hypothetical protein